MKHNTRSAELYGHPVHALDSPDAIHCDGCVFLLLKKIVQHRIVNERRSRQFAKRSPHACDGKMLPISTLEFGRRDRSLKDFNFHRFIVRSGRKNLVLEGTIGRQKFIAHLRDDGARTDTKRDGKTIASKHSHNPKTRL